MSYCVNCGVELAEYIKKCPLCQTEVINPNSPYNIDTETDYPEYVTSENKKISPYSVLILIAMIFLIPTIVALLIDINLIGTVTWSGYIISSLLFIYTIIAVGLLAKDIPVVIAELLDIFALTLFVAYISHMTGGKWFISFALPLIGGFALFMILITLSDKGIRTSILGKVALSFILCGLYSVLAEILISYNFLSGIKLVWSIYPLAVLSIVGGILIYIDKNISLKRKLAKRFFL